MCVCVCASGHARACARSLVCLPFSGSSLLFNFFLSANGDSFLLRPWQREVTEQRRYQIYQMHRRFIFQIEKLFFSQIKCSYCFRNTIWDFSSFKPVFLFCPCSSVQSTDALLSALNSKCVAILNALSEAVLRTWT